MNARLSQAEIEQNKIDAFNFLQRESKKVYTQIIKILKETDTKNPFIQDGFCKKIKDQIVLIKAPTPIRFYLTFGVYSVWLKIDTNYTISDYSKIGDSGYGVAYLKKDVSLCSSRDNAIEFSESKPDFKEITLKIFINLKAKRAKTEEIYQGKIDKYNKQMPFILR